MTVRDIVFYKRGTNCGGCGLALFNQNIRQIDLRSLFPESLAFGFTLSPCSSCNQCDLTV
jgi:hypothetical protein